MGARLRQAPEQRFRAGAGTGTRDRSVRWWRFRIKPAGLAAYLHRSYGSQGGRAFRQARAIPTGILRWHWRSTRTQQRVQIGADRDGSLQAIRHEATGEDSRYEVYAENTLKATPILYRCPNVEIPYNIAQRDVNTPNAMRAPGLATGVFALEVALDELACALRMDPLELRLRNVPDHDQMKKLPFSSIALAECLREGASRFGWDKRNHQPGSMKDGRLLLGWGMASANYPADKVKARARARITA